MNGMLYISIIYLTQATIVSEPSGPSHFIKSYQTTCDSNKISFEMSYRTEDVVYLDIQAYVNGSKIDGNSLRILKSDLSPAIIKDIGIYQCNGIYKNSFLGAIRLDRKIFRKDIYTDVVTFSISEKGIDLID